MHHPLALRAMLVFTLLVSVTTVGCAQQVAKGGKAQGVTHSLQETGWSLLDGARAHPPYRGQIPKKSDVVFSSRFERPNAVEVAKSFGATRVEWVYAKNADFVSKVKRNIGWFGGALKNTSDQPDAVTAARDFDDNPIVPPWRKGWNGQTNTTTHPDTQKAVRAQAKWYLDMGADSIQNDGPGQQFTAGERFGGDFNPNTLAGFPKFLENYPDQAEIKRLGLAGFRGNYREFLKKTFGVTDAKDYARRQASIPTTGIWLDYLRQTVVDHYTALRQYMNQVRGAEVPLSMNMAGLNRPSEQNSNFYLAGLADYALVETPISDTLDLEVRAATMRGLGIGYVPSMQPKDTASNRVAIATIYALGANPVVPWDLYVSDDKSTGQSRPRMSGTSEEYGDLYRFVRNHPTLFDGREQAAMVGIAVPVDKFDDKATMAVVKKLSQRRIPFSFIPTGGTQIKNLSVDRSGAESLKLIVTVNKDSDFKEKDLRALRALKVQRIGAAQMNNDLLDSLTPFVVAGEASALKLYPRALEEPGARQDQLVVHLVDENRGSEASSRGNCTRRVGLRRSALGGSEVEEIDWYANDKKTKLELTHNQREVLVTVPECAFWGVLAVTLKNH